MGKHTPEEIIDRAVQNGKALLSEAEAKAILQSFGLRVPRSVTLTMDEDPAPAIAGMSGPFVVKVMSEAIVHKTEYGGVALNLDDAAAVAAAISDMQLRLRELMAPTDGWLVEEMIPRGVEIVVGGTRDLRFGPVVMLGLGGILVELMADVAFRICPISRRDAQEMISDLRGRRLLEGWRGSEAVDLSAIEDALLAIGGENGLLLRLEQDLSELDINPMIATSNGVIAVDARMVLGKAKA